jgi:very-short-patch-repair endonuclease
MKPGEANKLHILHILQSIFQPAEIETEYKFHPTRRWRFDYAIPHLKLAIEYDGHGGFVRAGGMSRHGSVVGMSQDCEKLNSAICLGWRVLRFTALHFAAKERERHKLRDARETILDALNHNQP